MRDYKIAIHTKLPHGWEVAEYRVEAFDHTMAVAAARRLHERSAWR
jgi:hypothetical protein